MAMSSEAAPSFISSGSSMFRYARTRILLMVPSVVDAPTLRSQSARSLPFGKLVSI